MLISGVMRIVVLLIGLVLAGCASTEKSADSSSDKLEPIVQVSPKYPKSAIDNSLSGFVSLRFKVDSNGNVRDITILDSGPEGIFDEAAVKALSQWNFEPQKVKAPISQEITINFQL